MRWRGVALHWRGQFTNEGTLDSRKTASRESGSATPVVMAVMAVIVIGGLAAVDGGAVMVADAKIETTADLAALAGARVDRDSRAEGKTQGSALQRGCEAASAVARQNGVTLTSCERGPRLSVIVGVELPVNAWPVPLRASARAGAARG